MSATIHRGSEFASRTEQAVVRECVGGDTAAVAELYRRHHGRLIAFFVRRTQDRSLAEDLAHDSMLRFLGAVGRFDDTRPVWPYLKVTAHNVLIDHLRKSRRQVPVDATTSFEDEDEVGEDFAERVVLQPLLREAIALLPDRQQAAVELRYARGWSLPDAAEFLGMTTGALTQLLFRARQTLKAALEESGARLNGLVIPMLLTLKWRVRGAADRAKAWANSQPQVATVGVDGVVSVLVAAGLTLSIAIVDSPSRAPDDGVAGQPVMQTASVNVPEAVPSQPELMRDASIPTGSNKTDRLSSSRSASETARLATPDVSDDAGAAVVAVEDEERFVITHEAETRTGVGLLVAEGETVAIGCDNLAGSVLCQAGDGPEEG